MRIRAVAFILALTAGDYALWTWSVASGHDTLSLIAGLTLPPLTTLSLGLIFLAAVRLVAHVARGSSTMSRSVTAPSQKLTAIAPSPPPGSASSSSSGRLAA